MQRFTLNRLEHDGRATRGELLGPDGARLCHTLEDRYRAEKVKGSTRIPAGVHALEMKAPGTSRFDAKAARILHARGQDYDGMVRLRDVPDFSEILIHWGNYDQDTEGCLLVGLTKMKEADGTLAIGGSVDAFGLVYPVIAGAVLSGGAEIDIRDMDGSH